MPVWAAVIAGALDHIVQSAYHDRPTVLQNVYCRQASRSVRLTVAVFLNAIEGLMSRVIRFATGADTSAISAIYSPVVRETAISFEVDPPSVEEIHRRISKITAVYPWLVCEDDGALQGYAYASQHRERARRRRGRWSGAGRPLASARGGVGRRRCGAG